ncbi:hypothetical protein SAMN05216464_1045 [Mucilaginibacter pineti]|uniref:Uncharacterized protein n=1 Tax=Mucilaginibacter pineti TaxID=1391627 RepID=A0A1G7A954_9SPHI|nr:hypothetical protein [Mucilaginibacter pineti]SDE11291.1 hypothetical protein SAMN05216464_1045 [Mucilaginibacter pineti]
MADYCSNTVTFIGDNQPDALEYFMDMGYDSPPFEAILVDDDSVHFESRWVPPIKDLIEIAELFDVNYKLAYRLPNERAKVKYEYTCMQNEKLSKPAAILRGQIAKAIAPNDLELLETAVQEQAERGAFNNYERAILNQLLGKRAVVLNDQAKQPEQSASPARRLGR